MFALHLLLIKLKVKCGTLTRKATTTINNNIEVAIKSAAIFFERFALWKIFYSVKKKGEEQKTK